MSPVAEHCVALIVDRQFGAQLHLAASQWPVWVVESPLNSEHVGPVRQTAGADVTVFCDLGIQAPDELAVEQLAAVVEHHPLMVELRVVGAGSSAALQAELHANGFSVIHVDSQLIVAARTKRGHENDH